MREQPRNTLVQINEEEIYENEYKLYENEYRIMIVKMIQNLKNRMEKNSRINKDLEN